MNKSVAVIFGGLSILIAFGIVGNADYAEQVRQAAERRDIVTGERDCRAPEAGREKQVVQSMILGDRRFISCRIIPLDQRERAWLEELYREIRQ